LCRHDGLVSGREALAEDRQRCRPFSLTWLAICLAKPEHLSKSAFATGVQSMRGWLPNRAAPWLNRGLRPLTGIDDSGNAAIRGLLLAKQLAAGISARTFTAVNLSDERSVGSFRIIRCINNELDRPRSAEHAAI
jgi:hypothetical protein